MWFSSNRFKRPRRRLTSPVAVAASVTLLVGGIGVPAAAASAARVPNTVSTTQRALTSTDTDPTLVAAGDIACPQGSTPTASTCQQMATSNLASSLNPDYVLPLGDEQYEFGSLSDFQASYDPSWGRLNSISYPVPGNHEYGYTDSGGVYPTGGAGYFTYFGDRSHPLQPGCTVSCTSWYSYNIGSWHVVALDSQCAVIGGCASDSREYTWLKNDLNAHPATCTLAYWHVPLFASGAHKLWMKPIYNLLDTKGADVILNGHAHFYERFAPQTASGVASATAPREFIVGTGGRNFGSIRSTPAANSQVRIGKTFGVLQMTLSPSSYSWRFVPTAGGTKTDSGSTACA